MSKIQDKAKLKLLLEDFVDEMFDRFYITNPPTIRKSDSITRGYGFGKDKPTQSINFGFHTTLPSKRDLESIIEVFVDRQTMLDRS